jgi:hypothetical protein
MPPANLENPLKDLSLNEHKLAIAHEDKDITLHDLVT